MSFAKSSIPTYLRTDKNFLMMFSSLTSWRKFRSSLFCNLRSEWETIFSSKSFCLKVSSMSRKCRASSSFSRRDLFCAMIAPDIGGPVIINNRESRNCAHTTCCLNWDWTYYFKRNMLTISMRCLNSVQYVLYVSVRCPVSFFTKWVCSVCLSASWSKHADSSDLFRISSRKFSDFVSKSSKSRIFKNLYFSSSLYPGNSANNLIMSSIESGSISFWIVEKCFAICSVFNLQVQIRSPEKISEHTNNWIGFLLSIQGISTMLLYNYI